MPTYEYRCQDCGEKLEVVQSIHDDSLTTCPNCGGSLRKLFGNVGVVFKGSGFYKTDSRAKNTSGSNSSKSESAGSKDSGTDAKSEATSTKADSSASSGKSESGSSSSKATSTTSTKSD